MSDLSTIKMLSSYTERSVQQPGFFTGFFQSPPENYHTSEDVELDVRRDGNNVATVIPRIGALNRSENQRFTNKRFRPPIYGEEFSLNAGEELLKRQFGKNPFENVDFMASLQERFEHEMDTRVRMIQTAIEVQAAQIFRTGTLALPDSTGATQFTIDFQPKTALFTGASTDWDENSGTARMADVRGLCNAIYNNGNRVPRYMIMGELAKESWIKDAEVKEQFRMDGVRIGEQTPPQMRLNGAYHGRVSVGQFQLEMWTNNGFYNDRSTGAATKYVGDWDVIIISENARYDLSFGAIPSVIPPDPRLAPLSIGRLGAVGSERRIDLVTNVWFSENARNIMGSVEARALCIPTAIDTFGRLNAKVS